MEGEECDLQKWSHMINNSKEELWEFLENEEEQEVLSKIPAFLLLCLLMVLGIPGNILVLAVYGYRFPTSTTRLFIMAMAAYDLLNCAVGMPFEMVDLRHDLRLNMPYPCKLFRFLVALSSSGSVSVLIVVAVDRFRRICQPFRKQMTVAQSKIILGGTTIISLAFSSPALVLYGRQTDIRFNHTVYDCSIDDSFRKSSFAYGYQYVLGVTWVAGIVILVVMYSFIIYTINKQKKRRKNLSCSNLGGSLAQPQVKISITDTTLSDNSRAPALPSTSQARPSNHTTEKNGHAYQQDPAADEDDHGNSGSSALLLQSGKNKEEFDTQRTSMTCKSLRRLFSRDVNAVFHDSVDNMTSCDEEEPAIWTDIYKAQDTANTESLNNFFDCSAETDFVMCSESLTAPLRTRKQGYDFGQYFPWKLGSLKPVSSNCKKDKISISLPKLNTVSIASDAPSSIRRTSSLPSLIVSMDGQRLSQSRDSTSKSNSFTHRHSTDLIPTKMCARSFQAKALDNKSCASLESFALEVRNLETSQRKQKISNVTWDSLQVNTTLCSSHTSLDKIGQGRRTASVITQKSRRKSQGRAIRTSRVSIMMLLVTLGFVLSYLPHLFLQIYSTLSGFQVSQWLCPRGVGFAFYHLFFRSFFINNAINPIIYSFYNKTFRNRCLKFLRSPRSLFRSSTNDPHMSSASQDNDTS